MAMNKLMNLPSQRHAARGTINPEGIWTSWADFVNKVYHFLRLVGPQFRERPEDEPRVRLPAEPVEEKTALPPKGMCLDCGRQTGKVKGEYNFAYITGHLACCQVPYGAQVPMSKRFCAPLVS
eukprot:2882392-Amphidinium_carterae.1